MINARPHILLRAFAFLLAIAALAAGGQVAVARDGGVEAGVVISNRAEATYADEAGEEFLTVSPTISVTVSTVAAVTVAPDETEPSASVGPNERVTRLFRVCNTGNTPDFYTIPSAEVSAPAALVSLHFDLDDSGTLDANDRPVTLDSTMSPRLARGQCVGVLAVVDAGAGRLGERFTIRIVARSSVADALNAGAQDAGTIVNAYGNGARLTDPADPSLPPVKLVEGKKSLTTSPGQVLNYTITFRNSGDTLARNVVLRDELPAGLDYVNGTLRLGGRALTDVEDADEGAVVGRRIEVRVAQCAIGDVLEVSFQTRVAPGLAHGSGVVNTASVGADNAPAVASTSATVIASPFGVVYQGRTAGTPVPGARVSLVADTTSGALVPLNAGAGAGIDPNNENANPFGADGGGRWSFLLADAQRGAPGSPARYFLNVTAPGYRARDRKSTRLNSSHIL